MKKEKNKFFCADYGCLQYCRKIQKHHLLLSKMMTSEDKELNQMWEE